MTQFAVAVCHETLNNLYQHEEHKRIPHCIKYLFIIAYYHQWLPCMIGICVPLSCVWAIIRNFVLLLLEFCSAVWCLAADTHIWLLDCVVSGASFLAGIVPGCNIFHRRSVQVLCMLCKIRSNPMHQLCDALPIHFVPERVTGHDALVAHQYPIKNFRAV